ncbi:MAG: CRISPR-associated DxTHG motif protein [Anaerolineae bacterium]|nr:CRISPR-associated DxTHG motif protein [Anaerolineae bacterium]
MNLLTFLGTGNYQTACYMWNGEEYITKFAPLASCRFLRPEKLTVFLTEKSRTHFEDLCKDMPAGVEVCPVEVPTGKNEAELWQIFEIIADHVPPQSEAAFDITHGLRSFPLVALLAAAFLRSGLGVRLRAVFYGAYDVGEPHESIPDVRRVAMFDLTPMLSLLEWSAAADRLVQTGDARDLGKLLREQRKTLAEQAQGDPTALEQVGRLANLGGALVGISQALNLIRPYDALTQCAGLAGRTELARPLLESTPATKPYLHLLENVQRTFAPLGLQDADQPHNAWQALHKQRQMIAWYVEREHWAQAVTLAREWLVSWVMAHLQRFDFTNRAVRERIEGSINEEAYTFKTCHQNKQPFEPLFLAPVPQLESALALWNTLADLRNDLDHAGMRQAPRQAKDLIEQIQCIAMQMEALPIGEQP